MRAGLLSDPEVINRLNQAVVCTSIIIDDLEKRAKSGDQLAKRLAGQWKYPVDLMLLTPEGTLVSKLNSYEDFPGMHRDVSAPPGNRHQALEHSHSEVFLKQLDIVLARE